MIQITDKTNCCGCTACASICGHRAITMHPDAMGFLYPTVDKDKCVECGMCEKVCAFNDHYDISLNFSEPQAFAVRHKNIHEIETSRSGAAFIAFSDWVLEQGGVVYGVGYAEHFKVVHKRATTKEERDEFKGSKYVQSDPGDIFRQVKQDLRKGMLVLFSGTPCQTAGLASYIGKRLREKLIIVDIVCHGVPAPFIWRDCLRYLEHKYKQNIIKVNFRDKTRIGWKGHIESVTLNNGEKKESYIYTFLFYEHIMLRPSCTKCHYTNLHRPSDLTIADFWGWEKSVPQMNNDNKGISLVLVNTERGMDLFHSVKNELYTETVKLGNVLQPNLQHPSVFNPLWKKFAHDYQKKGFVYVLKRYGNVGWRYKFKVYRARVIRKIRKIAGIK